MSKYGAKKVVIDGITFDSKAEGEFYRLLKKMRENAEISDFELQPAFTLQPSFKHPETRKTVRAIKYVADFTIVHHDGKREVIDIKGFPTPVFKMKRKMFEYQFQNTPLRVLRYTVKGGFEDWDEYERKKRERKKLKA